MVVEDGISRLLLVSRHLTVEGHILGNQCSEKIMQARQHKAQSGKGALPNGVPLAFQLR